MIASVSGSLTLFTKMATEHLDKYGLRTECPYGPATSFSGFIKERWEK